MTDKNTIQLVNQGGKIVGIDPKTGETVPVEIDEAKINTANIEQIHAGSVTMFVRKDGNDDDCGLTEDTAKATIKAAIKDAPLNGDGTQFLRVDIGPGTFEVPFFQRYGAPISLEGSGVEKTTIIRNGANTLAVELSVLYVRDLTIDGDNSSTRCVFVSRAQLQADNINIRSTESAIEGGLVSHGGFALIRDGSIDTNDRCLSIRRGVCVIEGMELATNNEDTSHLVGIREGAVAHMTHFDLAGEHISRAVIVETGGTLYTASGSASDLSRVFDVRFHGYLNIGSSITTDSVDNIYRVRGGGGVRDNTSSTNVYLSSVPRNDSDPIDDIELFGGEVYFNKNERELRFYNGTKWQSIDHSDI